MIYELIFLLVSIPQLNLQISKPTLPNQKQKNTLQLGVNPLKRLLMEYDSYMDDKGYLFIKLKTSKNIIEISYTLNELMSVHEILFKIFNRYIFLLKEILFIKLEDLKTLVILMSNIKNVKVIEINL
jgi:hypothetical protein